MGKTDYRQIARTIIDDLISREIENTTGQGNKTVDCFRYINKEEFIKKAEEGIGKINENTTDIEFTSIMKRIFALLGDAHTNFKGKSDVGLYDNTLSRHFKIFDGFIYAFSDDKKEYIKVEYINGVPVEEIKTRVAQIMSYEVESFKNYQMQHRLGNLETYHLIKVIGEQEQSIKIDGINENGQTDFVILGQRTTEKPKPQKQNDGFEFYV